LGDVLAAMREINGSGAVKRAVLEFALVPVSIRKQEASISLNPDPLINGN
jgi:hypothetical protein